MGLPDPSEDATKLNSLCREILDGLLYATNGKGFYDRVTLDRL